MLDEATLRITIARAPSGTLRAAVVPPAPLPVARLFLGQTPETAARRAAMVFNICGAAQAGAVRAALGLPPEPDAGRRILRESLRDHAMKLAVGWPQAVGLASDPAALAAVARLGADRGAALAGALFGAAGPPRTLVAFDRWLDHRATAPARVLALIRDGWDAGWGRVVLPLWTPGAPAPEFSQAAGCASPVETGLVARHVADPLLVGLEARGGRSLLWRLAARLVDAAEALGALAADRAGPEPRTLAPGVGMAQAARGAMLVRAAAGDGRVTRLDRLSPTDAALHPDGLMARALATLPEGRDAPLAAVAAMVVEAVDPCLPYTVTLVKDTRPIQQESADVHSMRL